MNRRFFLLGAAAIIPAACANQQESLVSGGPPGGRLRFDVGSVLKSEVTMPAQGVPHGQNVARAVTAGTARGAGRRTLVLLIWGAQRMPTTDLVVYDNRAPYTGRRSVEVTEIPSTMAPRFDPDYEPPGPPRAFRFTYEGPMVSFELPRDLLASGIYTLLCPDERSGRTAFPNRVTARSGLWHTAEMNRRLADPRWTSSTTRPLVWES
jgi:hypothetical protein